MIEIRFFSKENKIIIGFLKDILDVFLDVVIICWFLFGFFVVVIFNVIFLYMRYRFFKGNKKYWKLGR